MRKKLDELNVGDIITDTYEITKMVRNKTGTLNAFNNKYGGWEVKLQ